MYFGTIQALVRVDSVTLLRSARRELDGDVGGAVAEADDEDPLVHQVQRRPRVDVVVGVDATPR